MSDQTQSTNPAQPTNPPCKPDQPDQPDQPGECASSPPATPLSTPPPAASSQSQAIFVPAYARYNTPNRLLALGHYTAQEQPGPPTQRTYEARRQAAPSSAAGLTLPADPHTLCPHPGWTTLLQALRAERQWPLKQLVALLDPLLLADIALAVVPTHLAYQAFWPMRTLAKQLAQAGRLDATSCLVRHTTIRRITFGGPSTRALHRATIRLENAHLIEGRRVLLLSTRHRQSAE